MAEKSEESIGALALMFLEEEGKEIACLELPKIIARLQKMKENLKGHPFKHEAVVIVLAICEKAEEALDCVPPTVVTDPAI